MATVAEFTMPAESFPLGTFFEGHPNVEVEPERIIPTKNAIIPYIWVHGPGTREEDEVEAASETRDRLPSVAVLEAVTAATGRDPLDLPPLYSVLDPDALDDLFAPTRVDSGRRTGRVVFESASQRVRSKERGSPRRGPSRIGGRPVRGT
jgi:hypothetical protein